jgi:CRISPR-associated protein Cas1
MNDPDASTEAERLSSRAGNHLAETQSDRRGQAPGEDRGAAIQAKALEILRREFPPPSRVQGPESPIQAPRAEGAAPLRTEIIPTLDFRPETLDCATPHSALPTQILPARMLNEFVYCPRLFYYEFVESVFVESGDTLRGKALHRRVDAGKGDLPPAAGKEEGRRKKEDDGGQKTEDGIAAAAAPSTLNSQPSTDEVIHSRSVQMGSERLGVTAKMDLIEVRIGSMPVEPGQTGDLFATTEASPAPEEAGPPLSRITHHASRSLDVCPVDYKAGAPKAGEDGNELWDTDRMQLGVQALILRDNGYTCNEGVIYYRETKQRVRLPITPELALWIEERIAAARRAAAAAIPPPLVASPKCPRCSLVSVCLPDETRLLTAPTSQPSTLNPQPAGVRRLIAARDDSRALYLSTQGLRVGRKDEVLQIKQEKSLVEEVRINDVSHVALFGNIQITTQTIQTLCELEVPVTYFSMGGWFYGLTRGHELKNVFLRIEQFRLARDPATCLRLARQFVQGKIRNHRTMLMRNHLEAPPATLLKLKQFAEAASRAESIESLLGVEGGAAAAYFGELSGMIKPADELDDQIPGLEVPTAPTQQVFNFNFHGRNRRPPTDPVNALLSLAYSLLAKDCLLAALAVGFDPYVGFYHQPRFGRPALALDLMEEFRPLVAESAVLTCINNRVVNEGDFVQAGQAVNLTAAGRKRFFQTYEQRMSALLTHPVFDYKVSYRRALELQARLLAKVLTGEIPEYTPLTTR